MVNKLAEMKVKQDLLVVDKRKNIFNTIGYRSRSAGNATRSSAATVMRVGAAGTNSEESKNFLATTNLNKNDGNQLASEINAADNSSKHT